MNRRNLYIGAGVGVAALVFLFKPKANAIVAPDNQTLQPLDIVASAWLGRFTNAQKKQIFTTNKGRAFGFIESLDALQFGGWFAQDGRSYSDVMGLFQVESGFNPRAFSKDDGGAGNHAYGIGQVLASTARDFGVTQPETMFALGTGVRVTLEYLKWIWEFLAGRLGRNPTKSEWIGAYNAGVGSVLNGNIPLLYIGRWYFARTNYGV